jgi:hypothetical protein
MGVVPIEENRAGNGALGPALLQRPLLTTPLPWKSSSDRRAEAYARSAHRQYGVSASHGRRSSKGEAMQAPSPVRRVLQELRPSLSRNASNASAAGSRGAGTFFGAGSFPPQMPTHSLVIAPPNGSFRARSLDY